MSSSNPFNNTLDWSFQGKYARVYDQAERIYEGWIDRVHHNRGSVILHDAKAVTGDQSKEVGSVFVRIAETIEVLKPAKQIEYVAVHQIKPSPHHDQDFTLVDDHMRSAYRNQFTGSFPVVRPIRSEGSEAHHYELINGHKRIEACRRVGLEYHPVEVVEATDDEARELFELAHRDQCQSDDEEDEKLDAEDDEEREEESDCPEAEC